MKKLAISLALALFLFGCVSSDDEFQRYLQVVDKTAEVAERLNVTATITFSTHPFEAGFKETFVIDSGADIRVVIQAKAVSTQPSP